MIDSPEALLGRVVGGCRLERVLGVGGSGAVYLAQPLAGGDPLAVKVLLPPWQASDAERAAFRARFLREIQIGQRLLRHPRIVPILSAGEAAGVLYLTMPLYPGGTLARRFGPLNDAQALAWLEQAAAALDYAHAQGVVHRDLKPANLLLDDQDRASLADFGILRLVATQQTTLTATGQVVGTPAYMAPEQAGGQDVGPAADRYSLGVIAFELFSGRLPFSAPTPMELMLAHLHQPPPSLAALRPDLPASVDAVLGAMLAKAPRERYPSAAAFVAALRSALAGDVPELPPTVTSPRLAAFPPTAAAPPTPATLLAATIAAQTPPTVVAPGGSWTPTVAAPPLPPDGAGRAPRRRRWLAGLALALALVIPVTSGGAIYLTHQPGRGGTGRPGTATATVSAISGTAIAGGTVTAVGAATSTPPGGSPTATAKPVATATAAGGGNSPPPTSTPHPPTATPVPPTATPVPPTATPVPLASGSAVYDVDSAQYSARRLSNGGVIWQTNPTQNTGARGPLALANGVVYVTDDSVLYALNASSSGIVWQTAINAHFTVGSRLAVAGGLGVIQIDFTVTAFNLSNGSVAWKTTIDSPRTIAANATIANGVVYIGQDNGNLYALDLNTGNINWKYALGASISGQPFVANGLVYIATYGASGAALYAVTTDGSRVAWSVPGGGFDSQPQVAGGVVYFGDQNGVVNALNAGSGAVLWQRATGGEIIASANVSGGVVYIGSTDNHEYALSASNGAVLWSAPADGNIDNQAAVGGGLVLFASFATLYAVHATNGATAWTVSSAGGTLQPLIGP